MNHIVAIHGNSGGGKNLVARSFEMRGYKHIRFSDTLHSMFLTCVSQNIIDNYDNVHFVSLKGHTLRHCYQTLGTEWRNIINHNLWVDIACRKIKEQFRLGKDVVISDLRFPNEYVMLQDFQTVFLNVNGVKEEDKKQFEMFPPNDIVLDINKMVVPLINDADASSSAKKRIFGNRTQDELLSSLRDDWWNNLINTDYENHESERFLDISYRYTVPDFNKQEREKRTSICNSLFEAIQAEM